MVAGKVSEVGDRVTEATPAPVPLSGTVWVVPAVPPALSVIMTVADWAPTADGVKVTEMVQVPLTATLLHVFVSANSAGFEPPSATLVTVKGPLPLSVRVMVCAAEVAPILVEEKVREVGAGAAAGTPTPVPLNAAV